MSDASVPGTARVVIVGGGFGGLGKRTVTQAVDPFSSAALALLRFTQALGEQAADPPAEHAVGQQPAFGKNDG